MKRFNCDFSSRFRILKGGKISLVVSAMLVGSLVNVANADTVVVPDRLAYTTTLVEDTDFEIVNLLVVQANQNGESAFVIDAMGHNTNITVGGGATTNGLYARSTTATNAISGINITNLGTGGSSITTSNNYFSAENLTHEAYAITSMNGGMAGTWENMHINIESDNADAEHGIYAIGSGFAEGIFVDGDFIRSSITNTDSYIYAVKYSQSTALTEAYGIDIGDRLMVSSILNDGNIHVRSNYKTYGIFVGGNVIDSQIENIGTISTKSERNLSTNENIVENIELYSSGIELNGVLSESNSELTSVKNSGEITSESIANIIVDGQITTQEVIATSKGVYIGYLDKLDAGFTTAFFENSGEITATSKLDIDFINEGDSVDHGDYYFNATATGVEVVIGNRADITNTTAGSITALAQVDIGEEGTINTYNLYAIANGIKSNQITTTSLGSEGTIDSQAIFNGTNYSKSTANGIYVNGEVDASLISLNNSINAEATATSSIEEEYSEAYANARGFTANELVDSVIMIGEDGDVNINSVASSNNYSYARSYGINVWNFSNSMILNNGNIEVTATAESYDYSTAKAYGINIYTASYEGIQIITNNGTIKANVVASIENEEDGELEANSYGIHSRNYTEVEGSLITNGEDGVIEAFVNNELDKDGYSLYVNGGSILQDDVYVDNTNILNDGVLRGNIYAQNSTLTNNGTIELAYNANNAYIKNFTNSADGTLKIGLLTDGTLDNTIYSQLNTNNATFEDGSTIDVNVLSASTNVGLLAGNRLEYVVRSINLTIDGALNITDNSALLNFNYVAVDSEGSGTLINGEEGGIHLDVVKASENNIVDTTVTGGGNTSTKAAAKALQTIQDSGNHPAMTPVFAALNALPTAQAVSKAVESTTPVAATAAVGTTAQISNGIAGIVQQRQNVTMGGGLNSGDGIFAEKNFWIKPFGSVGEQKNKDGMNGFDLKAYGIGFGFDGEYKADSILGVGFFYTNAEVDVNNVAQKSDLDVYTALLYGNIPVIDNKTKFLYQAGYSLQKTSSKRDVFTGDTAESKYTGKTAYANTKLLRDVRISDKILLQPLVDATYRHFTNPAYQESGAGALNLNVDKFTSEEFIVGTGVIGYYTINDSTKLIGNLNVGYDMINDKNTVTSAYQGASGVKFDTDGIDNGRWSYEAGIGIETDINKTSNINLSYNYNGKGSDFGNNTVSMKYVLKF